MQIREIQGDFLAPVQRKADFPYLFLLKQLFVGKSDLALDTLLHHLSESSDLSLALASLSPRQTQDLKNYLGSKSYRLLKTWSESKNSKEFDSNFHNLMQSHLGQKNSPQYFSRADQIKEITRNFLDQVFDPVNLFSFVFARAVFIKSQSKAFHFLKAFPQLGKSSRWFLASSFGTAAEISAFSAVELAQRYGHGEGVSLKQVENSLLRSALTILPLKTSFALGHRFLPQVHPNISFLGLGTASLFLSHELQSRLALRAALRPSDNFFESLSHNLHFGLSVYFLKSMGLMTVERPPLPIAMTRAELSLRRLAFASHIPETLSNILMSEGADSPRGSMDRISVDLAELMLKNRSLYRLNHCHDNVYTMLKWHIPEDFFPHLRVLLLLNPKTPSGTITSRDMRDLEMAHRIQSSKEETMFHFLLYGRGRVFDLDYRGRLGTPVRDYFTHMMPRADVDISEARVDDFILWASQKDSSAYRHMTTNIGSRKTLAAFLSQEEQNFGQLKDIAELPRLDTFQTPTGNDPIYKGDQITFSHDFDLNRLRVALFSRWTYNPILSLKTRLGFNIEANSGEMPTSLQLKKVIHDVFDNTAFAGDLSMDFRIGGRRRRFVFYQGQPRYAWETSRELELEIGESHRLDPSPLQQSHVWNLATALRVIAFSNYEGFASKVFLETEATPAEVQVNGQMMDQSYLDLTLGEFKVVFQGKSFHIINGRIGSYYHGVWVGRAPWQVSAFRSDSINHWKLFTLSDRHGRVFSYELNVAQNLAHLFKGGERIQVARRDGQDIYFDLDTYYPEGFSGNTWIEKPALPAIKFRIIEGDQEGFGIISLSPRGLQVHALHTQHHTGEGMKPGLGRILFHWFDNQRSQMGLELNIIGIRNVKIFDILQGLPSRDLDSAKVEMYSIDDLGAGEYLVRGSKIEFLGQKGKAYFMKALFADPEILWNVFINR